MTEIVALAFVAIIITQNGNLFDGFHTLGDDPQIELLPQGDHGGRDRLVAIIAGKVIDE